MNCTSFLSKKNLQNNNIITFTKSLILNMQLLTLYNIVQNWEESYFLKFQHLSISSK